MNSFVVVFINYNYCRVELFIDSLVKLVLFKCRFVYLCYLFFFIEGYLILGNLLSV